MTNLNLPPDPIEADLIEAVCEEVFDLAGECDEVVTGGRPVWDEVVKLVFEVLAGKARIAPVDEPEAGAAGAAKLAKVREFCSNDPRAVGSLVATDILDIINRANSDAPSWR